MECPICQYPVLADGSTCRRCGGPLHVPIIDAKIPGRTALLGKRTAAARSSVIVPAGPTGPVAPTGRVVLGAPTAPEQYPSPAARAAAYLKHAPADALMPGMFSRRDNLLPRATRSAGAAVPAAPQSFALPATVRVGGYTVPIIGTHGVEQRSPHRSWRRGVVTGVVAVGLTMSAIAALPAAFGGRSSSPAAAAALNETRATNLLRRAVSEARGAYVSGEGYTSLSTASLNAQAHHVHIVGLSTVAHVGTVSMHVNATTIVTFASPADARRCVFARDDAARGSTVFVTVSTSDCRASAAPAAGWRTR